MANPFGVFTVDCPKAVRNEVSDVEYNIYKGDDRTPLMVLKNSITNDDVMKAARCAGFSRFIITNTGSYLALDVHFPISCNICIREYVEYKIIRAYDTKLIQVVKGGITKSRLDEAAAEAGFGKEYTIEYNKHVEKSSNISPAIVIKADVYLRRDYTNYVQVFNVSDKIPTMQPKSVEREFKIFDENGRELMVVKGSISANDAHKSIKCAGFKGGEGYITKKGSSIMLKGSDFPIQCDLVVMKKMPAQVRDPIFHICESTSIPPVKKPVAKIEKSNKNAKQKLIKSAIDALCKLERII